VKSITVCALDGSRISTCLSPHHHIDTHRTAATAMMMDGPTAATITTAGGTRLLVLYGSQTGEFAE
jgi:hypothetical protein